MKKGLDNGDEGGQYWGLRSGERDLTDRQEGKRMPQRLAGPGATLHPSHEIPGRQQLTLTERIAVFLDLENLLHPFQEVGEMEAGERVLTETLNGLGARGTIVYGVAVCNKSLARRMALLLQPFGIRTFVHQGGEDAADFALLRRISDDVPPSCETVVIGSGDGIFVRAAQDLRGMGKRVEAIGVPGTISSALRFVAQHFHRLPCDHEQPREAA